MISDILLINQGVTVLIKIVMERIKQVSIEIKLYRLKDKEQKRFEKSEDKYRDIMKLMHTNPYHAYLSI